MTMDRDVPDGDDAGLVSDSKERGGREGMRRVGRLMRGCNVRDWRLMVPLHPSRRLLAIYYGLLVICYGLLVINYGAGSA